MKFMVYQQQQNKIEVHIKQWIWMIFENRFFPFEWNVLCSMFALKMGKIKLFNCKQKYFYNWTFPIPIKYGWIFCEYEFEYGKRF